MLDRYSVFHDFAADMGVVFSFPKKGRGGSAPVNIICSASGEVFGCGFNKLDVGLVLRKNRFRLCFSRCFRPVDSVYCVYENIVSYYTRHDDLLYLTKLE